ncbi:MAG: long-chain fatty acid--CoA ligase [Bacteroidales bacterium]|nr:long-chain fatty acid--CoA ligase [Bacteroidales bacterium]
MQNFIEKFETTIKQCWDFPALTDYKSETFSYSQIAKEIATMHLVWKAAGIQQGDKISLNARSCANWAKVFMAVTGAGNVAVQLFNGFTPADAQKFTHHSDSRILFTEKAIFDGMDFEAMPHLLAVFDIKNFELLASRGNFAAIHERGEELFNEAFPEGLTPENINYTKLGLDELCCINYTSGSTGNPKGVMLTVRNISSNIEMIPQHFPYRRGDNYLSVLPFAHIFGLLYDMIACLCTGLHLTILGLPPAPSILKDAMQAVKPRVIMMVPLVLSKMAEFSIGEFVHSRTGKARLADHENHPEFCHALRTIMLSYLGGECEVIVTGGAAIPEDLEQLLITKLDMPLVTGYGMTECAPTISLGHLGHYKLRSCGEIVERMQARINSADQRNTVGELWVKGDNTFIGYYKNPEADKEVFTEDGWFRTGDLGTIDDENTLFLVGRCKSMLLASNGQNVYPEEIEVKLNVLPYIAESIIVQRGEKFTALIVPNADQLTNDGVSAETLGSIMAKNIETLNRQIPSYSQISDYELRTEPFAKTPKGSIKRFMYC